MPAGRPRKKKKPLPQVNNFQVATYQQSLDISRERLEREMTMTDLTTVPSPAQYVSTVIFQTMEYYKERKEVGKSTFRRNDKEIEDCFEVFKWMVSKIQEQIVYNPTLLTFCQFVGLTKNVILNNAELETERGLLCRNILEFCEEGLIQNVLTGKTKEVSGIFILKSLHGYRDGGEAKVQIMNVNAIEKSVDDILADFNNSKPFE